MSSKYDLDKLVNPCGINKTSNPIEIRNSAAMEAMASITNPLKHQSAAMEALSKYASSLINNKALGLQADIQKIIAATTLMPDLKNKLQNFDQKIHSYLWEQLQTIKDENSIFFKENQFIINDFNQKYGQNISIDRTTAHAINSIIHDSDALGIASELIDIGIFDTSSGSIIYDYLNNVPKPERNKAFLNFVLPILLPIIIFLSSNFEPVESIKNRVIYSINHIEGHAVLTSNSYLKDTPDGETILEVEKGTMIKVYESEGVPKGWVEIRLNKDNIDIKGYLKSSDIKQWDN